MSRRLVFAILSALLLIAAPLVPMTTASATSNWPVTIDQMFATNVQALETGEVTLNDCNQKTPTTENITQYDSDGSKLQGWKPTGTLRCDGEIDPMTDADGVVYALTMQSQDRFVTAYKDGVLLWQFDIAPVGSPNDMKIGYDGGLYFLVSNGNSDYLVKLLRSNGTLAFNRLLPEKFNGQLSDNLQMFEGGVAVLTGTWGQETMRYYDLAGNPSYSPIVFTHDNGDQRILKVSMDQNGTAYATVDQYRDKYSSDVCIKNYSSTRKVIAFNGGGIIREYDIGAKCASVQNLNASPTGAVLYLYMFNSSQLDEIISLDGSSTSSIDTTISGSTHGVYGARSLQVDTSGNVVLAYRFRGPEHNDNLIGVRVYDTALTQVFSHQFTDIATASRDYFDLSANHVSLTDDAIVMAVCNGNCSTSTNHQQLLKLSAPVGMDYPRGALPSVKRQLNYVALGDSFSSGEGVEPFDPATDFPGVNENRCHRSELAYAHLLDQDGSLNLDLQSFRACSGATTQTMRSLNGQWGEGSQLESITSETDVITLTIGGNDVLFKEFATKCVGTLAINPADVCDAGSAEYQATMDVIDNDLQDLLSSTDLVDPGLLVRIAVKQQSVGSDAEVYVIGYPQLAPASNDSHQWPFCSWLSSSSEHVAARDVVSRLNLKISLAVTDMGAGFQFIDPNASGSPFIGHELCDSQSYFNGPNPGNVEYSLHPNSDGQEAYADLIKPYIP